MARATVFNRDPAAQAQAFERQGFEYLHLVDLDGAFAGKPMNASAVEGILGAVKIPLQLGGGIRDRATIDGWLGKGVARVIIGTAAVRDPALVKEAARAYPGRVAVGLDARDGKVAVEGWAETSELSALDIARRFEDAGVAAIVYTDVARDGMLKGLNLDATIALADCGIDPGDRLGRSCLDRRHTGVTGAARAENSQAPSPAARSMMAGSMRRRRSPCCVPSGDSLTCSRSASFPASTSRTAASSRASISSICATPAIRSRPRSPMTKPAPTSSPSSTSRRATRTAASCSTWCGARPKPASCRSPSAAACAPSKISAHC